MDGFARRKEQSKEDIRKAAWELFSQFGVEKVSIVEIARKAGVSQATIYNNFGSKDTLAREFVSGAIEQLVSSMQAVLSVEKPFWEKMEDMIRSISQMMAQGKTSEMDMDIFAGSHNLLDDPEIKKIRAAAQEKMVGLLLQQVRAGKAQGQIRADLTEEALRFYFLAFMDIFPGLPFRQGYVRDPRLLADLCALMIHGLKGGSQEN